MFNEQNKLSSCCTAIYCKIIGWLVVALLLLAMVAGVFLIRNWYKTYYYIGVSEARDTITINGEGEVTAVPDIATFSVGLMTEKSTVAMAQEENTNKMNAIIKAIKDMGVDKDDIKTSNYNIYPRYDWNDGKQTLRGYQVSQNLTVKVRELDKVGEIFAQVGDLGANNVSGLQFTIDEPEKYKQEARLEALANAQEKAEALSDAVGIRLGKVVGFSESGGEMPNLYRNYDMGMGGMVESKAMSAPEIEVGSTEIKIQVSVSYEVL